LPDEPGWSIESGDAIYLKQVHDDWICHHEDWYDLILRDLVGGHTWAEQEDATDFRFEGPEYVFLGDKDGSFIF